MEELNTYSLRANNGNSDEYYQTIAAFTDGWLAAARVQLAHPVESFMSYRTSAAESNPGGPALPGFDEAAFEMLVLGVQLRENGAQALQLAPAPTWVLARLVEAQDRLPIPAVDGTIKAMRAVIHGLAAGAEPAQEPVDELAYKDGPAGVVQRLVEWLRAHGSTAQARRMEDWAAYLATLDAQEAEAILARCLILAEDFSAESEPALGKYTEQVDDFVTCVQRDQGARWRYDTELITRTKVEYHLGMLGTEILTRAYRERYLATPRKIVVVPDCLCARSSRLMQQGPDTCQAEWTELGGHCQSCTPGCRVRALTRLGEQRGFEISILPDNLRGVGLGSCSRLSGVGVVGVSCALTNWDAGWLVNDAGVPAQGVLLDYAGCRNHWHEKGVSTDLNVKKLLETIGVDRPPVD